MRWFLIIPIALVVAFVGFAAYVRLVPVDPTPFHSAGTPRDPGDYPSANTFTAVRALTIPPDGVLMAVLRIAESTARTELVAGSVADGIMTFRTMSAVMAYPDFTTVSIIAPGAAPGGNSAPLLQITGRSRFGKSDLGVNKARVQDWLAQLGPLVVAP